MKITVIGSGYVGLVAGACLAEIGHEVILVDNNPAKFAVLAAGVCPIHEKHLPELLARHRGKRLTFSDSVQQSVRASRAVFIAVGTPPAVNGAADLSYVESVARDIAGAVDDYKIVVNKSTVPVYTSEYVRRVMLLNGAPADHFDVCSNPEFLREGTAVTDFLYPDRIVLGVNSPMAGDILREIYRPITDGTYYQCRGVVPAPGDNKPSPALIVASTKSAELIKYASNAFLAMKISFINAVATFCESVGADIDQVRKGIGADSRIGERFLQPGIGYGGSCFPKDLSAYRAVARECGYDFRLLEEVMRINNEQLQRFLRKVRGALWTLRGKRLAVLGLAFKGDTDDIRESPAIAIVDALLREGCLIQVYDPAAMENARQVLDHEHITFANSPYEAAADADALLLLTEWREFRDLDFARVRQLLNYPIVIDGRNLLDPEVMRAQDFYYVSMGRPDVVPAADKLRVSQERQLPSVVPITVGYIGRNQPEPESEPEADIRRVSGLK